MSENSTSCTKGCVTGTKTETTCLPNLVSPADIVAGKRPCKGKLPFNVPWARKSKGWPAGSMVHTSCGYFFTLERAYGNPCEADSSWIEFDWKFLFNKLLESMSCGETCPDITSGVKHWNTAEGAVNVANKGETWCFLVEVKDDEGNVISTHHEYASMICDEKTIDNPTDKPECWTDLKTPEEIMLSLLEGCSKCITDVFGSIVSVNAAGELKLDCDKLIEHCKLATKEELGAVTPSAGDNGNWFIGGVDSGIPMQGPPGTNGTDGIDGTDGTSYTFAAPLTVSATGEVGIDCDALKTGCGLGGGTEPTCTSEVWAAGNTATVVEGSDGQFYKLKSAGSAGNDPVGNTTDWLGPYTTCELATAAVEDTTPTCTSEVWSGNAATIVEGSDGKFYKLKAAGSSANDPVGNTTDWLGPFDTCELATAAVEPAPECEFTVWASGNTAKIVQADNGKFYGFKTIWDGDANEGIRLESNPIDNTPLNWNGPFDTCEEAAASRTPCVEQGEAIGSPITFDSAGQVTVPTSHTLESYASYTVTGYFTEIPDTPISQCGSLTQQVGFFYMEGGVADPDGEIQFLVNSTTGVVSATKPAAAHPFVVTSIIGSCALCP